MSTSSGPDIITNGLVLYLDAANYRSYPGTGTDWFDLSANGNNGTLVNGVGYSTDNQGVMVFDGIDDYVDTSDLPFRFSNTFTVTSIFYWDGINIQANILGKRNNVSPFNQYSMAIYDNPFSSGASNKLHWFARRDGGGGTDIVFSYALPSAGFYTVSVVMSALQQTMYVNSVPVTSSTTNISTYTYNITGHNFLVGTSTSSTLYWDGLISLTSIYNRALTAQEIKQNYLATKGRYGL